MGILTEINRISAAKGDLKTAINLLGGGLTDELVDEYAAKLVDADLAAGNIKTGVTIFGTAGTLCADATAAEDDILNTRTAYGSLGTKLTGTMPNNAAANVEVTDVDGTVIPAGYYNGSGSAVLSADEAAKVITGNIKSGVTLLGVAGAANVVDTSDATAAEGDIRTGTSAYVDGVKLDGSLTPLDTSSATATASDILTGKTAYISDGTEATGTCDFNADTTDATATAADIAMGETAYIADGTKATGTSTAIEVTDGVVITSRDANGYALTVDHYGTTVKKAQYCSALGYQSNWYLMTGITFKNTLTVIDNDAFHTANKLALTTLPSTLTTLGARAFRACSELAISSLPSGFTTFGGSDAFLSCGKITVSVIPNGVTVIPIQTFKGCVSITSIIGARVSTINTQAAVTGAFNGCTGLVTATFGSPGYPVSEIDTYAFTGCTSAGTLTVYTADGNPLANSPYGWVGTVVHTAS